MFLSWVKPRSLTFRSSSAFDLAVGVLGQTDRAGLGDSLEPRSDVDAVAHEVAVALLDDIAEMNAKPELDALLGRHAGVALDHGGLDFDRAAHRVDQAAELDDRAVAGALDDAAVVHGNDRVDQVAAKRPEPRQRAVLVGAGEPAVAGDVGHQNRRELPGLAHGASAEASSPVAGGMGMAALPCCTGRDVEAGVQPRVSTGRSIHAPLRITRSPREK